MPKHSEIESLAKELKAKGRKNRVRVVRGVVQFPAGIAGFVPVKKSSIKEVLDNKRDK